MKKKLLVIVAIFAIVLSLGIAFAIGAGAEETGEPELIISGKNLVMNSSVNIRYLVTANNVDIENVKVLVWSAAPEAYVKGTENYVVDWNGTQTTVSGVAYKDFDFTGVNTKMLTDDFYAVAYANVNGEEYYSAPQKYSVLRYAYNQLAKTSIKTELKNIINSMLDFGANAQIYFKYKTDTLANSKFYKITVANGTLPDGFNDGLYYPGKQVVITANTPASGYEFVGWQNSKGEIVSTDVAYTVTVGTSEETYTAIYSKNYSKGLKFSTYDGGATYLVKGLGTCTDTHVTIPATYNGAPVVGIDEWAFECEAIETITLPASIQTIGEYAFYGCELMTDVLLEDGNATFKSEDGVLYSKDGKTLVCYPGGKTEPHFVIPEGVETIALTAVCATQIEAVTIPASVTVIDNYAFADCYMLTDVYYGGDTELWGTIQIGTGNADLKNAAFHPVVKTSEGLSYKMNSDNASYTLNGIGDCDDEQIVVPTTYLEKPVTSISTAAFAGSDIKGIVISESINSISDGAFARCKSLEQIDVNAASDSFASIGGNLYNKEGTKLLRYAPGKTATTFALPEEVTEIGNEAFSECENIAKINVGSKVSRVGERAFSFCPKLSEISVDAANTDFSDVDGNLYDKNTTTLIAYAGAGETAFTMPEGVNRIGDYAFYGCASLKAVVMSDTLETIGISAFSGCTSLEKLVTPDSLLVIEQYAFADCISLTEVTLGEQIYLVDDYAFVGCISITDLYYNSLDTAWEEVTVDRGNSSILSANIHFADTEGDFEEVEGDTPIIKP